MTNDEKNLAYQLIGLSQNQLDAIKDAILIKNFAFARILYARLETDLRVLNDLIQKED